MTAIAGVVRFSGQIDTRAACERISRALAPFGVPAKIISIDGLASFTGDLHALSPDLIVAEDRDSYPIGQPPLLETIIDDGLTEVRARRGTFALAIYDKRRRRIALARDIAGGSPLYVYRNDQFLAFASMPGALAHFSQHEPDPVAMAHWLAGSGMPDNRSFWKNIRFVPSGTIEWHGEDWRRAEPLFDPGEGRLSSLGENCPARLAELLDQAVARAVTTDDALTTVHLSSGLDSNAVLASALRVQGAQSLLAITAAPNSALPHVVGPHRIADESKIASRAAAAAGIRHVIAEDETRIVDSMRGMARYFHAPVSNPINFGWGECLARVSSARGAKRMLAASHGNAVLSFGGLPVLSEWLRRSQYATWARQAFAARKIPEVHWPGILHNSFVPWIPPAINDALIRARYGEPGFAKASFARREILDQGKVGSQRSKTMIGRRLEMIDRYDSGAFHLGLEALTGVKTVDPCGDRDLIEFSLALPPDAFLDGGQSKPLFRKAMANRIPAEILTQPRRGFQGADFFSRMSRDEAMGALEEIKDCHGATDIIDIPRLEIEIGRLPQEPDARFGELFSRFRHITDALSGGLFLKEIQTFGDKAS